MSSQSKCKRVAYIINQYPKVSHSFVRREIQALEEQGVAVERIAVRGWDGELVDSEDLEERRRTRFVLKDGALPLVAATVRAALTRPKGFARALSLAVHMGRRGERPLPIHLIYLAEACRVLPWVEEAGVQHLHAHFGTNPAELAMLVHELGGPGYSFTVHGPEEFDKPQFLKLGEKIARSAFVVAISSYGSSQLRRWVSHQHWDKLRIVHCGLDDAFSANAPAAPPDSRQLVCIGRLCEQKGQLLLVAAAAQLAKAGVDFRLVLAGDGEMRPEIEALIAEHQLGDKVRITGWISSQQVREELLASRAMVLPSFAEGLPVVIMEAMALRRPVVSTYVAGIPELVLPNETGWLVPAGDVASLAQAMQKALEATPEELVAMGDRARKRVLERHSITGEATKLATCFNEVVAASEAGVA